MEIGPPEPISASRAAFAECASSLGELVKTESLKDVMNSRGVESRNGAISSTLGLI
jgi:hypothetical protein